MKLKFVITLVIIAFTKVVFSQNSSIKGKVIDKLTGEALPGAMIKIEGTTNGSLADFDGNYVLKNITSGTYSLVFSYISYKTMIVKNVIVSEGGSSLINASIEPNINEVDVVEVVEARVTNTESAVIFEMKKSNSIVSGTSAAQISKSQDRDAAEVVKRIPGVTIIENRFIMVRGLSDRYNNVWMNDAGAPSSETDKKAFSFDILPAGLIDRVLIYKTPSPELPGDFAGGMVKIYTKSVPDKQELIFNYQLSYRDGSTFNDFNSCDGIKKNNLGYSNYNDLNTAALHSYVSKTDADNSAETKTFKNSWGISTNRANPDERFNITYGVPIKFKKFKLGSVSNINYSNVNTVYTIYRQDWDSLAQDYFYADKQSINAVKVGILENLSFVSARNKIDFRMMANQMGNAQVVLRDSYLTSSPNLRAYQEGYDKKQNLLTQLSGKHTTKNENTEYTWTGGYSITKKDIPDLRKIRYTKSQGTPDSLYYASIPNGSVDPSIGGRFFSSLNEKVFSFSHNFKQKFHIKNYKFELDLGNYLESKKRTFAARVLGYTIGSNLASFNLKHLPIDQIFGEANIGVPGGFRIEESTSASDKYWGQNKLIASYLLLNLPIGKHISVVGGARYEYNVMSLQGFVSTDSISPSVTTKFLLPSINITYNFKADTSLLRFAFGKTVNRPEFREWAPFYFYDFDLSAGTYGSLFPNVIFPQGTILKVAEINNFDLRYEYYPTRSDFIQVGVFYKQFFNPIQQVVLSGGGDSRSYTFINAESAYTTGVELDGRKNLEFVDKFLKLKHAFSDFNIVANASFIKSQLKMPANVNAQQNSPLQGQSPYVVNTGLYYQNDSSGTQISVLYNVFGSRIAALGTAVTPNIGEISRNTLDLNISQKIAKYFYLSFSIQDIFNQPIVQVQDTNRDGKFKDDGNDKQMLYYKRGRYYSVGIKFKL
jgi:outer membrane receptor protein involved in Fe transport